MKPKFTCLVGLLVLLFVLVPSAGAAQGVIRLHVDYVDNSKFPQVDTYLSIADSDGLPITTLTQDLFTEKENGQIVTPLDFTTIPNSAQPLGIALLMDTNASMWTRDAVTPLKQSIDEASRFIDQLGQLDQLSIIQFSDQPAVVFPLGSDKYQAKQALSKLQTGINQRAQYDAIAAGVKALNGFPGRRIIVMVTNGQDTQLQETYSLDGAVNEAQKAGVPVYILGFGDTLSLQQLQKITEGTGGFAYIRQDQFGLQSAFDSFLQLLHFQYRICYLSALPANNNDQNLEVTLTYNGDEEQTTSHFLSMSNAIPVSMPDRHDGDIVGGIVSFKPVIDWPAEALKSLDISVDGTSLKTVTATPFEYDDWNSAQAKLPTGLHEFVIKVTDIAGNTGHADVKLDVEPPITVKITNPADGDTVQSSSSITADVTPLTGIAVQKVEFYVDDKLIGTSTTQPYQATWDAPSYPAGPHSVKVMAYDSNDLFPSNQEIRVNVQVGSYSWLIILIVLAAAALVIPIGIRARRRNRQVISGQPLSGQPLLREIEGLNPGQVWPLGNSEVRLGRKRDENNIPLQGLKASRHHALITLEGGRYIIASLSPDNPVIINNQPVPGKQVLHPGNIIQLGETTLRYEQ